MIFFFFCFFVVVLVSSLAPQPSFASLASLFLFCFLLTSDVKEGEEIEISFVLSFKSFCFLFTNSFSCTALLSYFLCAHFLFVVSAVPIAVPFSFNSLIFTPFVCTFSDCVFCLFKLWL